MFDVVALGESLIDFTPNGTNAQGIELFARNPGGAPANVLAMNAHLGGKTAFIGKVGKDGFGDFLRQTLVESGIDVSGLVIDEKIPTTLAFVQLGDWAKITSGKVEGYVKTEYLLTGDAAKNVATSK